MGGQGRTNLRALFQQEDCQVMAIADPAEEWDLSPFNPFLEAAPGEGINNSDVDLFEYGGKTYVHYATGDQSSWGAVKVALFDGGMREFYESHFPAGLPAVRVSAKR